ncbi:Nuclear localization 4 like [Labeo rohita]|uniref:Nuclear localization 4 like n=1 Tax=Labeo rohita TaxID=84645 RepID=A0A498LPZ9_LABRO|nr:Nuclear localization 4 like [Labeo rohita]
MNCLLALLFVLALGAAQKSTRQTVEWDYKTEAEKVNLRGCANLTLVLDNWKYAIMTQVKDLLLNDHSTVLPDYGRIQPLSEALNDLYKEFNSLKERLAELTTKFEGIELFVDEARSGRSHSPPRAERPPPEGEGNPPDPGTRQGRRNRVVVRRVKKPDNSQV